MTKTTRVRRFRSVGSVCAASILLSLGLGGAGCGEASEPPSAPRTETPAATEHAPLFEGPSYVSNTKADGSFTLAAGGALAPIVVNAADWPGVRRVAGHLRADIQRVTGAEPALVEDAVPSGAREVILVGTLGKSELIDGLVTAGKLNVTNVTGKWDTFSLQVVEAPLPEVERALVIAGADKRGTIYGMYDVSARIGVSPWYFWADVPAQPRSEIYVRGGSPYTQGTPKVKYRGIFINDENPALYGWANETQGGFGSVFYEKVFELMSRLRANYLWPAMWGKAFAADDTLSPALADEYGIVMGTSHHEPMMRAQREWTDAGHASEDWNYGADAATVRQFWQGGVTRMGAHESIVTLGMRGDGDEPLEGANVTLMQQIVSDQRNLLQTVTGKPANETPQLWALYKEVQDFYDQGMQVPEDVTLLFADDNWGNVRRVPDAGSGLRPGGYGIYYHADYVGGPRSYRWLNTNPISKMWEQLNLAYEKGIDRIFLLNVGDIKPMEFPIEFFLDFAWDPVRWPADRLPEYTWLWAKRQFGAEHANEIADILSKYTKYNGRRKPELLAPDTYSHVNYREAEQVVADYNAIAAEAQRISDALPANMRDAFYQLVLHPTKACANMTELYLTVGKNALYARQGRAATNDLAAKARQLFAADAEMSRYYNEDLAGGKWAHMMDQTHIGYTTWEEPAMNVMPAVQEINVPSAAAMSIGLEGSESYWPQSAAPPRLPELSPYQPPGFTQYIDVFNRGTTAFDFTVTVMDAPWLTVTPASGTVTKETRLAVAVDWAAAPAGSRQVPITITGAGTSMTVQAPINHPEAPKGGDLDGFVETDGYISIDAPRFSRAIGTEPTRWEIVPDLGRNYGAVTAMPVAAPSHSPGGNSSHLEYDVHLFESGSVRVDAYVSPSLQFHGSGLRYAVSFDDATPQTVNIHQNYSNAVWEKHVSENVNITSSNHTLAAAGKHTLKFWLVDTGVTLQKLVISTGTLRPSYLGPPSSMMWADGTPYPNPPIGGGFDSEPGEEGTGGSGGSGGTGGNEPSAGTSGSGTGAAGAGTSGGSAGTNSAAGGAGGSAGAASAAGGTSSTTGGAGSGASAGNLSSGATSGSGATGGNAASRSDSGCGCRVPAETPRSRGAAGAALAFAALAWVRRRRGVRS